MNRPISLAAFAVVFAGVYLLGFINSWASFRFYPVNNLLTTADLPRTAGPAMGWYAWILQGFIAGLLAAGLTALIPLPWTKRAGPSVAAVAIGILIVMTFAVEWHWFQGR